MAEKKQNFLNLIEDQRSQKVDDKFTGTFLDYLELIRKNPDVVCLSHKRLANAIESHGVDAMDEFGLSLSKAIQWR